MFKGASAGMALLKARMLVEHKQDGLLCISWQYLPNGDTVCSSPRFVITNECPQVPDNVWRQRVPLCLLYSKMSRLLETAVQRCCDAVRAFLKTLTGCN